MKEERDVIGKAQPEEESKTKKYIRIAFGSVLLSLILLVFVMTALKRCWI
jgi:hypothetical protein